jgi:Bifunctional DNA primase/polymerase, N-terminal/AAA domain
MSFLDIAKPLAERGFRVFPLIPREKAPVKLSWGDHFDAATTDLEQLEQWDREVPRANVGMSPDEIFCYLETDSETELKAACADLPPEIWDTARITSGRPDRACYVFRQTMRTRSAVIRDKAAKREGKDNLFEFKAYRTYVTGPGSIHPKTRQPYTVEWRTIPAMPDILLNRLCELYGAPKASESRTIGEDVKRETALLDRFLECYEVATTGDWFNKGKQWYRPIECPWRDEHENQNEGTSSCIVYTEGGGYGFDCKHRCSSKGWKEFRAELEQRFPGRKFLFVEAEQAPGVTVGESATSKPVTDWRAHYHSAGEHDSVGPPRFLIEGFLPEQAIMGVGAFVGQKKTLVALNIAFSLCSGEPLFGKYKVTRKPARVLYIGPENGLISFSNRVNRIGLREYLCQSFFYSTMSLEKRPLTALMPKEIQGAAIFIDTAIRFTSGSENDAAMMKEFADQSFRLIRNGAACVIMLHHSSKSTTKANELTLDNSFRGTGELSAFLSVALAMRTQDMEHEYESTSLLRFVKQRDFEPQPSSFEVTTSRETCRMTFVDGSGGAVVTPGNAGNKDGKDDEAVALMKANRQLSVVKLAELLKEAGIKRSKEWVRLKRLEMGLGGLEVGNHP